MHQFRVLISTSSFASVDAAPLRLLEERGFEVRLNPMKRQLTEAELGPLLEGVQGLLAGTEPLTDRVLTQSTLKVICRVGTGTDNVDYDAAKRHGIDVFNTPDAPTEAVAELTVGGILAVLRHIHVMHAAVRSGCWQKTMGGLLQGRTIGIVGLGRIGRRVAELLEPYHVILLAADPYPDKSWASSHRVEVLSLPELLSVSDIVTLHAAAPKTITPLIGSDEFALMKRGSVLINTARGSLVDEDALCAALTSGVLSAAYLDVFRTEPYCGRLAELPNVLLTAHAGTYTRETRQEMEMEAVRLLLKWFDRHSMARVV